MPELSTEQVKDFYTTGYFILPGIFDSAEIAEMRAAFDYLQETAFGLVRELEAASGPVAEKAIMHCGSQFVVGRILQGPQKGLPAVRRVSWCGSASAALSGFGRDPRLLGPASQLLGCFEMQQLINQAHFKLPGDEVVFDWHQDSTHRGYGREYWCDVNGRGSFVQTAIAIDEVTEQNGPLRFIPGTTRLGHLDLPNTFEARVRDGVFQLEEAVSGLMKPGDVAFFHPYCIHGSEANRSDKPRRILINGFAYPGANTRQYPGDGAGRIVSVR